MVRGGSSPLGRTVKAPLTRGFSMPGPDLKFRGLDRYAVKRKEVNQVSAALLSPPSDVGLAECVGAGGEVGVEASSLFGVERREHLFLDGGDSLRGADEAARTVVGEGETLVATATVALDKVGALERG